MRSHRPSLPLRVLVAVAGSVALVAGACGDEDATDDTTTTAARTEKAGDATTTTLPPECQVPASPAEAAIEQRGAPTVPDEPPAAGEVVDLEAGEGTPVAAGDTVTVHYVLAKAADGTKLESTWEAGEPQEVALGQVSAAFASAMEGMQPGGRRVFIVPAAELFGGQVPEGSGVTADDELVFVVDLVASEPSPSEAEAGGDPAAKAAAEERDEPEVTVPEELPDELVIIDDVVGEGDVVCPDDTVVAYYVGKGASSGEVFDRSSWEQKSPATFPLDGVIQGWTEGLVGMKVGGRRTLVIPGDLAYGESPPSGDIEPNETLVFTIDLVGIA